MAKRVSTTTVGAFIVSALALIVAAVMVFGSGRFFRPRYEFVCFFGGSLNGLKPGAAVKFRGVQIGSVTSIRLRIPGQPEMLKTADKNAALPVFIELDQKEIVNLGAVANVGSAEALDALIARGLRAQLVTESILTGLLYVDLDIHEGTPPTFILPPGSGYREIPTVPTSLQQLQEKAFQALARLDQIDFAALINSMTAAAQATRELVGSRELRETIVQLKETASGLKAAVAAISRTTNHLDNRMDPLIESLKKTSDQATATLASAQTTLTEVNGTLDPDSPVGYQVVHTLENMSEASRAVTALADYLQRNPSALVRGKAISNRAP
jgi:paraquat-inducible protein B